jgi:pectinesterase
MMRLLCTVAGVALTAHAAVIVAADGSGQFKTVQEAINAAPSDSHTRFGIHIKPGIYKEHIVVPHGKPYLNLVGEDAKTTILTNDWYAAMNGPDGKPLGTFRTSSTSVEADDFRAENITFENSAGPKGQAVALAVLGDRAAFRNCRFLGWQDTLLAQTGRQYFENSYIEGVVDFIFGGSVAFFDRCQIHVKGNGYITAASTPKDQPYGYVFSRCRITGEAAVKTDLGRPWRDYAAVTFLDTEMSDVVRPAGWNNWQKPEREKTSRYAEYGSGGPGANAPARVGWARQLSGGEARAITMETVLRGIDGWNPIAGSVEHAVTVQSGKSHAETVPAAPNPAVAAAPAGTFHRISVAGGTQFSHASSTDQLHWSAERRFDVMANQNAIDVEHPSLFYDPQSNRFIISWSSTIRDNFFQSYQEDVNDNPRRWFTTTSDFQTFSPSKVLFEPNYPVRDGVIFQDGNRYGFLHEDSRQAIRQLRVSFSHSPLGPWGPSSGAFPVVSASHPSIRKTPTGWLICYEGPLGPAAVETRDFWKFTLK